MPTDCIFHGYRSGVRIGRDRESRLLAGSDQKHIGPHKVFGLVSRGKEFPLPTVPSSVIHNPLIALWLVFSCLFLLFARDRLPRNFQRTSWLREQPGVDFDGIESEPTSYLPVRKKLSTGLIVNPGFLYAQCFD